MTERNPANAAPAVGPSSPGDPSCPSRLSAPGLSAPRLDVACAARRTWRCDLEGRPDPTAVEARLAARAYTSRCRHAALRVLRHRDGHEIAWVTASGRIQIRLSTAVERGHRRRVAHDVHRDLAEAFEALDPKRNV